MKLGRALALCLALCLATLSLGTARAQAAEVQTTISTDTVFVGETFRVQIALPVTDDSPEPASPKLSVRGPAEVRGPSIGSSRSITMHNFSFSSQTQVTASYSITATGPGKITIGPGSFQVGSKRVEGEVFEIQVQDGPPRRSTRSRRDPFDDFFRGSPFDLLRDRADRFELPQAPEWLTPEHAPDQIGFLLARVSKKEVVVGETVTLTIYAFGSRGAFQEANPVEPALGDFLSFREIQSSFEEPRYQATIDGQTFQVAKLRQIALVPLRSGKLEIGPMRAVLAGRGYPQKGPIGYPVESAPLHIEVREAPKEGQPPGFFAGDVGRFRMDVELTPTRLTEGEYALLSVQVRGTGNLPTRVQLPEGSGWEWQKPVTRGEPEVQNGELKGTRTIEVGLRVTQPGQLDLGEVTLPYYDPGEKKYKVLRKRLPVLEVAPRETPPPAATPSGSASANDKKKDPVALGEWTLGPRKAPATSLDPVRIPALTWPIILGSPPLLLLGSGLFWALGGLSRRVGAKRGAAPKPKRAAEKSLSELKRLIAEGQSSETPSALRRAIEAVLFARYDFNGRGLTQSELHQKLVAQGGTEEEATWLSALLARLEASAYGGEALSKSELEEALRRLKAILSGKGGPR